MLFLTHACPCGIVRLNVVEDPRVTALRDAKTRWHGLDELEHHGERERVGEQREDMQQQLPLLRRPTRWF